MRAQTCVLSSLGKWFWPLSFWKPPVSGFEEKAGELGVYRACSGPWHDITQLSLAQPKSQTEFGIRGSLPAHLCLLCATVLLEGIAGTLPMLAVSNRGCACKLCSFSILAFSSIAGCEQITHQDSQNPGGGD